jgi:LPS-assembly lipoprotein
MKKYLGLALVLCLSACGFHLKGSVPLGDALHYQVWAVDGGTMQTALENALRRQSNVRLDATNPEVLVKVLDVRQQKDVSAINIGGNTIEYMLNLRVDAQAWRAGEPLGAPISVQVQRYMAYADSEILGKQEEEAQIWREMRADAAAQMVRRLAYLPKP